MSLWTLVEFKDGLSVIPDSWMIGENEAYYPHFRATTKIQKAVTQRATPTADWKIWKIERIFGKYDTYKKAVKKLKKAERTSDINTDELQHSSAVNYEDTALLSEIILPVLPEAPALDIAQASYQHPVSFPVVQLAEQEVASIMGHGCNGCQNVMERLQRIEKDVSKMKLDIRCAVETLNKIAKQLETQSAGGAPILDENIEKMFPITSVQEMEILEMVLKEDNTKLENLVQFLKTLGGQNINDVVRRILTTLFTNELAVNYSWEGRKGKMTLKEMEIIKAISKALTENCLTKYNCDRKTVEIKIKEWFRQARGRIASKLKNK